MKVVGPRARRPIRWSSSSDDARVSVVWPPFRELGTTGMHVSRVGCGGWQFGGGELPGPRPGPPTTSVD